MDKSIKSVLPEKNSEGGEPDHIKFLQEPRLSRRIQKIFQERPAIRVITKGGKMSKWIWILVGAVLLFSGMAKKAFASDPVIEMLQEKGVITADEAQKLYDQQRKPRRADDVSPQNNN